MDNQRTTSIFRTPATAAPATPNNRQTHLIICPLERIGDAGASAELSLTDVALLVAIVVVAHQTVGRPLVREEKLQGERQQFGAELRVFLLEVGHVDL